MIKKIFAGIGILILLLIVAMVITVAVISTRNKPRAKKEEIMKGKDGSSKKAMIVYQPGASNFTEKIAHKIAKGLNDNGYEVTIDYPGTDLGTDVDKYSVLVFGSPVYGGKPLSIVTDYMSKLKDLSSKKIVLYSTGAGKNMTTELDEMEKALQGTKPYKKIKFVTSTKKDDENKAYNLGKEF